jgi:hypothetical protein
MDEVGPSSFKLTGTINSGEYSGYGFTGTYHLESRSGRLDVSYPTSAEARSADLIERLRNEISELKQRLAIYEENSSSLGGTEKSPDTTPAISPPRSDVTDQLNDAKGG